MRKLILALLFLSSVVYAESTIDPIITEATTNSTVNSQSNTRTKLESPPPSAISPTINTSNSDLCTFGVAGAIQTQILGISTGTQVTDENCERLKLAKTLFDMGMKVAAVSTMCQDKRVFDAMMDAGTPCPFDGMIGEDAKAAWLANEEKQPGAQEEMSNGKKTALGGAGLLGILAALLAL